MFGLNSKESKEKNLLQKRKELRKLVKKKQHDDALKLGLEILQKAPYEQNVLFIVGGIYYMKNQYQTAIPYFERALDIGAYDVEVLTLKANSHYFLGEPKKALACCEKIKEIDPKNKAVAELLSKIN
ncbi:tetratricopeptide repeat protein [Nitrosarchaeum koreense]|uniref:TPR repeat-containing protein n=1 Tax=Nitrosarchaeum koreense MY1 TaxID=1001994 RepID=F9CYJ8_9ARCH|nr:tetratricopeptide repeat protein [Nitrosarchaeum koreense]EGP94160.1 TPR repeat-containing protein [Nitrosarchaeum koreense MY1]